MLTYGALCELAARHGVTITENVRAFVRAVEEEDLRTQADARPVKIEARIFTAAGGVGQWNEIDAEHADYYRNEAGRNIGSRYEVRELYTHPEASAGLRVFFDKEELDALYEAIEWAKDEGLPGTAEHLQAIFDAHDPEASAPGLSERMRECIEEAVDYVNSATMSPSLEREGRALLTRASAVTVAEPSEYKDSTPHLRVGDSSFESWYAQYDKKTDKSPKQRMRDAYAAGMGDPLVVAREAAQQQAEPSVPNGWRKRLQEMRDAAYTYSQYPELAQAVFDSVIDALEELETSGHPKPPEQTYKGDDKPTEQQDEPSTACVSVGDGRIWDGEKWLHIAPGMETYALLNVLRETAQQRAEHVGQACGDSVEHVGIDPVELTQELYRAHVLKVLAEIEAIARDRTDAHWAGFQNAIEEVRTRLDMPAEQQAEPHAKWGDPRVQQVYEILCRDDAPPAGEHWEGFQARLIVDALFGQQAAVAEKSDFATFYVPLGWHSGREGLIGKHGIDRDFVRQALYLGAPAVEIYEGRRHVFVSVAAFEAWMRDHAATQQEATK